MAENTGNFCISLWYRNLCRNFANGGKKDDRGLSGIFLLLSSLAHFLWILAVPCFIALVLAWKIFKNIEEDHSFCMENADALRKISFLAAADSAVLFVGNVLFLLLNMNHPSILLGACIVVVVGIGISVAAAVLSHLVRKAAKLQEENELTI